MRKQVKKMKQIDFKEFNQVVERYLKSIHAGRLKWYEKKLEEYEPFGEFPSAKEIEDIVLRYQRIVPEDKLFDICLIYIAWLFKTDDVQNRRWKAWRKVNAEIQRRKKLPRHLRVYLAVMD